MIGSEQLAEDLLARGVQEVRIASFCDYDVVGWDMPVVQARHLARYGVATRDVARLVTPGRFTEDELRRLSIPLDTTENPAYLARLARFMSQTGGIAGQPRGIQADHLLPVDRVVAAFQDVAGAWVG